MSVVRPAVPSDMAACAELAGTPAAHLSRLLAQSEHVFLVAEWAGAPVGFVVASPLGHAAARIDHFQVEAPGLWPNAGQHLLRAARARLKERGIQTLIVADGDAGRNALLESEGLSRSPGGWTGSS